jgi:hypothetical protein
MPFTLAHPLGALPFKWISRRWFSTTGLVFGSMSPDFEYFIKRYPTPTLSELGWGVFLFDFPLAILGALIFHLLIKEPLLLHLPGPYDRRLSGYAHAPYLSYLGKHWAVFLFSILLGIGTHLLLDWLTNPAQGPLAGTALTTASLLTGRLEASPLLLLEHAFSFFGLFILLWLVLRLHQPAPSFQPATKGTKWLYWALLLFIVLFLVGAEWRQEEGLDGARKGVTTLVWALFAALVVAAVLMRFFRRIRAVP